MSLLDRGHTLFVNRYGNNRYNFDCQDNLVKESKTIQYCQLRRFFRVVTKTSDITEGT